METNAVKIEIFQGKDDQWYFRPVGGNGEILATSEGYATSTNAERAANELLPGVEVVDLGERNANV